MSTTTADNAALGRLYRVMAGLLAAVAVLAFGFVLVTGENWLQLIMAAVGGVSLGLVPWMGRFGGGV